MPNIYDRSYNQQLQDGDDCPPNPFSMAYGGNDNYDDPKDAWDFVGMSETQRGNELKEFAFPRYQKDEVTFPFLRIHRETEKSWLIVFQDQTWAWFPKKLCRVKGETIVGPRNFMKMKGKEATETIGKDLPIGPKQPLVDIVIGIQEPCPYCGSNTSCDCASPGTMTTRILRPPPAVMAKLQLKKFIAENK